MTFLKKIIDKITLLKQISRKNFIIYNLYDILPPIFNDKYYWTCDWYDNHMCMALTKYVFLVSLL